MNTSQRAVPRWHERAIPAAPIVAALAAWFGLDQLLLWRFLDVMPGWVYALGFAAVGLLCAGAVRHGGRIVARGPSVATLTLCIAVALFLLMLGGEGRFFYANIDWQVRFAVLRDMTVDPWPFVYTARAVPDMLRAPIGMFLVPALVGKAVGERGADIALLAQNALLMGILLALGSTLFETRRARGIALLIFLAFSGLDIMGRLLFRDSLAEHLENWAFLQYSSTITLAFWVPNHAISGWVGALGFLLWRAGRLPLGLYLALLPLTALWSPLGLMGAMPFAALAGVETLTKRSLRPVDIALPSLATLLSLPGLAYMSAANADVGARFAPIPPVQYAMFELFEILIYAVPLLRMGRRHRFGLAPLIVATAWLLAIPFIEVGWSTDFMMRGSITSLAILAVLTIDAVLRGDSRRWLVAMLLIGSITGLAEIRRALIWPAAPRVTCSFFKAWDQNFRIFPKGSYVAPLPAMPAMVRPAHPTPVSAAEPARCWNGVWHHPGKADPATLSDGATHVSD